MLAELLIYHRSHTSRVQTHRFPNLELDCKKSHAYGIPLRATMDVPSTDAISLA